MAEHKTIYFVERIHILMDNVANKRFDMFRHAALILYVLQRKIEHAVEVEIRGDPGNKLRDCVFVFVRVEGCMCINHKEDRRRGMEEGEMEENEAAQPHSSIFYIHHW